MDRLAWSREELFARFAERNVEWNGRFLTCVKTTGIYCIPSCSARKPKFENVIFVRDEDTAKLAGFRACKRCRPDNFYRKFDPDLEVVEALAGRIRRNPANFPDVKAMQAASGLGKTKLSESFREHFHESPASFLSHARVASVAARIATKNAKPLELAFELGFESSSTFHDNFAKQLAIRPGEYRKLTQGSSFKLRLPADFNRERTLALLGRDQSSVTESLVDSRFAKALRLDGRIALLVITVAKTTARCELESARPISPVGMTEAHAVALRMLGLTCDPAPLQKLVRRTKGLRELTKGREGLRVLLTADVYEALVWSIIGQQVNLPFAMALRTRLVELTAPRRSSKSQAGLLPHPNPEEVAKLDYEDLRPHQFSQRKAEYVIDISRAIAKGEFDLDQLAQQSATRVSTSLLAHRGIGPWSANYVMMRGIGFNDSLPVGDSGLAASLKSFFKLDERPDALKTRELMKPLRPHQSLACLHFWQRLHD